MSPFSFFCPKRDGKWNARLLKLKKEKAENHYFRALSGNAHAHNRKKQLFSFPSLFLGKSRNGNNFIYLFLCFGPTKKPSCFLLLQRQIRVVLSPIFCTTTAPFPQLKTGRSFKNRGKTSLRSLFKMEELPPGLHRSFFSKSKNSLSFPPPKEEDAKRGRRKCISSPPGFSFPTFLWGK